MINDVPQSCAGFRFRFLLFCSAFQKYLSLDILDALDEDQPALRLQSAIYRADLTAKSTIDGHAQSRCLPIHCATTAHDQIGMPQQVEPINHAFGNDDL